MKKSIPRPAAWIALVVCAGLVVCLSVPEAYADPPAMNPFAPRETVRDDAVPGYVELSDGKIHFGMIHLTRDKRLKINDDKIGRQREVPLRVVTQIDGIVKKEWMEKEWRFKELALDEKMFTGRQYPAREHLHEITLRDGRKIKGPLAAVVYLQPGHGTPDKKSSHAYRPKMKTQRFTLYKRTKGKPGTKLKDLVYVKRIKLGEKALEEGRRKATKKSTKGKE